MLRDLMLKNRSYRRFHEDVPVDVATLRDSSILHVCPLRRNMQPLRCPLHRSRYERGSLLHVGMGRLFEALARPGGGRAAGGLYVVLADPTISIHNYIGVDHGLAMQNILLGGRTRARRLHHRLHTAGPAAQNPGDP